MVTKPLGVFSLEKKMAQRFASVPEDELWEICIFKQLLNSVSHDIMNYQNLVSVLSAEAEG